jgi:toxin-antitoxin system PIN domain toxin
VILVDANLLVYAHNEDSPGHLQARDWLTSHLNGYTPVGLPWPVLLAFIRIATNPRIFPRSHTVERAWELVGDWLDNQRVWIPQPTERHRDVLASLLVATGATGNLVMDAHLAALAIEHGLILCSADTDFARFPRLRWRNPLAAG